MTHPPDHHLHPLSAPRRFAVLGLAVVALVGLTTACDTSKDSGDGVVTLEKGSKGKGDDTNGTGKKKEATAEERQDAMLEYAACMREHGVDMPDPKMSSDGGMSISVQAGTATAAGGDANDADEADKANEACGHIMDDVMGEPEPMSPEEQAKFRDEQLAYAKCMRDNGVDMPDPEIDFDGGKTKINMSSPSDGGQRIDPNSETFKTASTACESKLGDGRIAISGSVGGPGGGVAISPTAAASGGDE